MNTKSKILPGGAENVGEAAAERLSRCYDVQEITLGRIPSGRHVYVHSGRGLVRQLAVQTAAKRGRHRPQRLVLHR